MKSSKKAKSANGAAVLLALIGIFIVVYVLFLPSDYRQELLEGEISSYPSDNNDTITTKAKYDLILRENPGRLDLLRSIDCVGKKCSHQISSFSLFKTTSASELQKFNPFIIKNNIMTKKFHSENFEIIDMDNTENIFLSFSSYENKGTLTIRLNDEIIFEKDMNTFNPDPINLPKSLLKKANRIDFEVNSVGWKFWETNLYKIENMKVIGDITDLSRQKTNNVFYITDTEYYNLEKAKLRYSPNCNQATAGMLQIMLNHREIFYGVPDCQLLNVIEFSPRFLEKGDNTISFKTESGSYMIDLIEIRTDLKEVDYPVYYFDLDTNQLDWVEDNLANLTISLEFVDKVNTIYDPYYDDYEVDTRYSVIINVNGNKRQVDTYDKKFHRQVPRDLLREENNWVMIEPRGSPVDIASLMVQIIPNES